MVVWARQPTIRRENTSITNATYTNPRQVATYVKSATHNWFGCVAENCRCTRSADGVAVSSGRVVRTRRPRTTPCRPAARIWRSTVQRAAAVPSRWSCRHTLRTP